jgi:hypothetical protein
MVAAPAEDVFELLDDHARLSSHMSRRSWKMGWGKMETVLDAGHGQAPGSRIILRGRVFGVWLYLEEIVTRREPPHLKMWETVGTPRLLVIGRYQLGFELTPGASGSHVRVFIDYDLPDRGFAARLGRWFGDWYARWCTGQMVREAARLSRRKV